MPPGVARLQAYCNFALVVAKADGRIAQAERATIRSYLGDLYSSDAACSCGTSIRNSKSPRRTCPKKPMQLPTIQSLASEERLAQAFIVFAQQIAVATGEPTEKENQFLARLATTLEFRAAPEVKASAPRRRPPVIVAPPSTARDVLGIPEKAELSVDLIRRKYTMLSEQINPEKAASLGPEFAKMAEAKRAAVKAAAEELLAPFNAPAGETGPAAAVFGNLREELRSRRPLRELETWMIFP